MLPTHKAGSGLAVGSHTVSIFHVEYHWFTAASLVSSSLDILHKQSIYIADRLIACYNDSHSVHTCCFTNTQLTTALPDQLTEV